jgi:hypothetical protein
MVSSQLQTITLRGLEGKRKGRIPPAKALMNIGTLQITA